MESDLNDILPIHNSEFVLTYNAMRIVSRDEMLQSIKKSTENTLYIFHKLDKRVIGAIFIVEDQLRYKANSVCLAYYLSEEYAKNGYMSEALTKVIELLFDKGFDIISARTFSKNIASFKLLKKLGFLHEGTIRHAVLGYNDIIYDDDIFSITKKEFYNYFI